MAQVAVSVVLLVGSSLFLRSLVAIQSVDPGFHAPSAGIATLEMSSSGYSREEAVPALRNLAALALSHTAISDVAMADRLPLSGTVSTSGVLIPGHENPDDPDGRIGVETFTVSPSYFEVMGIGLHSGRRFDDSDDETAPPVVIVSRSMAQRYWPGETPLGQRIQNGTTWFTVVGVARDIKVRTLGEAPRDHLYFSMAQRYSPMVVMVVAGRGRAVEVREALVGVVRDYDPSIVMMSSTTMTEHLSLMLFGPRMAALLLAVAGGLALVLAAVGLYGVVSYAAARRTHEIGIRISLGADRGSVTRMVVGSGMRLVAVGAAVGLILAFVMARLAGRFLYGVSSADPLTFLGVPLALATVAALAAYMPARRASRVDPLVALRSD